MSPYRKRIGNVVFFNGVEQLSHASNDVTRSPIARKALRLQTLRPAVARVIEEIIDDMLDELEGSATGGAR
jgi:hypothetical protein